MQSSLDLRCDCAFSFLSSFQLEEECDAIQQLAVAGLNSSVDFFLANAFDSSLRDSLVVHASLWEHIHSENSWKSISVSTRDLFSCSSFLAVLCLQKLSSITNPLNVDKVLYLLDVALIVGGPAFHAEIHDMIRITEANTIPCSTKPFLYLRKQINTENQHLPLVHAIDVVTNISIDRFWKDHLLTSKPVLLKDQIKHWRAFEDDKWARKDFWLKIAGNRTVPIEIGKDYRSTSWRPTLMTLKKYINEHIEKDNENIGYLAQSQIFDWIPQLRNFIAVPDFLDSDGEERINIWFGPKGTITPCHYDSYSNLLCQVVGSKYVRLYEKENDPFLYPFQGTGLFNTSQVSIEFPDYEKHPLFRCATFRDYVLQPGDMLFVPDGCWHYVRSLSTSISVSFWW